MSRLQVLHADEIGRLPVTCELCPRGPADEMRWLSAAERACGCIGVIATAAGTSEVVGHLLWAPPAALGPRLPLTGERPAPDAPVIMEMRVLPEAGGWVPAALVQRAAGLFAPSRRWRALQVRGTTTNPSCVLPHRDDLVSLGFQEVRAHPVRPWLRLDFDDTVTMHPRWWAQRLRWKWAPEAGPGMARQPASGFADFNAAGTNE